MKTGAEAALPDLAPPSPPSAIPGSGSIRVLKFGGTSLAEADRIRSVARLIDQARGESVPVVVVSAVGSTTDRLQELLDAAVQGRDSVEEEAQRLSSLHRSLLAGLAGPQPDTPLEEKMEEHWAPLGQVLQAVTLLGEASPRIRDRVLGLGEGASALLLVAALEARGIPAESVDARELIVTDGRHGGARVQLEASRRRIGARLPGAGPVPVVTGFVAATEDGAPTTLGRGGSDYTATLIGAALEAECVELWTDVDGVLTADPRAVPEASPLRTMGYDELVELARLGARVVCPLAVEPVRKAGIPLRIRSTLDPDRPGTLVRPGSDDARTEVTPVQGVSAISGAALLRLGDVDRIGLNRGAERLFRSLEHADVPTLLFSQDSGAHSLSVAIPGDRLSDALEALDDEFRGEREAGLLAPVEVEPDCSVLAAVGRDMRNTPGVAGAVFQSVGDCGVNVRAIAQGASERNISWVVSGRDEARALRAVHGALLDPLKGRPPGRAARGTRRDFPIVVVGAGGVGSALLDQLATDGWASLAELDLQPRLAGVARSRAAALNLEGFAPEHWRDALAEADGDPGALPAFLQDLDPGGVVVDCTASADVGELYPAFLAAGHSVVTANKLLFSGPLAELRAVEAQARRSGTLLRFETTVGAGLPLVEAVRRFRETGDPVLELEGTLSGTLTYLFDQVNRGVPFSRALEDARAAGLTEPDPRQDLGLSDVVRKLVILGRMAGFELEADDIRVEPLLDPSLLDDPDPSAFERALPEIDGEMARQAEAAAAAGVRLLPLARLDRDGARIELARVPLGGPFGRLEGTENALRIRTRRYQEHPLVIQGPGAGPEVTAAGLLADLLDVARQSRLDDRRNPSLRGA
jgi:bifunctional aspartokinase / homoserine dehydrogenase 1